MMNVENINILLMQNVSSKMDKFSEIQFRSQFQFPRKRKKTSFKKHRGLWGTSSPRPTVIILLTIKFLEMKKNRKKIGTYRERNS